MKKNLVTIVRNPVLAQLVDPDNDVRDIVGEVLSFRVSGHEHMKANSSWDGTSSLFKRRENRFPAGFVRLVKKKLERAGYRVVVRHKPIPEPQGPEHPVVDDFGEDPRYDYQMDTVRRLVQLRGMVAQIATGGGKSRVFKLCCARLNMPTLFVTTRKTLMYQMAESYAAGKPTQSIGVLGDGTWKPAPNGVNFAIVDTLVARLEKRTVRDELAKAATRHLDKVEKEVQEVLKAKKLPSNFAQITNLPKSITSQIDRVREAVEARNPVPHNLEAIVKAKVAKHEAERQETLALLRGIQFLCLEEAHEVSSDSFTMVADSCSSAWYRLALTATPFMKDDEEANMRLMAATGTIGIKVSEKLLIDRGILATPYFKYITELKAPPKVSRGSSWQRAYKHGVVDNAWRNEQVVKEALTGCQHDLPVMILVQQQTHGRTLEKMLQAVGINAKFIFGQHEQDVRARYLEKLGNREIDVLIGSTILDVGVDVPAVGMVILAGGGKAEVAIRQRIGRGLRAKKGGANVAFIVDFTDPHNSHLANHGRARRQIVESTPGFAENIVKSFDYSLLKGAAA